MFRLISIIITVTIIMGQNLFSQTAENLLKERDKIPLTERQLAVKNFFSKPSKPKLRAFLKIDYSEENNWFAYGKVRSLSKFIPDNLSHLELNEKEVAAFYVPPAVYWGSEYWNAPINHSSENIVRDLWLVNQASIFSACCDVYVPKFRSVNLYAFFDKSGHGSKALLAAYKDIESAFLEFLKINGDKPFIIAGHSQGTFLLNLLITEYESTPEFDLLVAAYVVGQDIRINQYKKLISCQTAKQIGCYVGWNTTLENTDPIYSTVTDLLCINPLSGMQDENAVNLSGYSGSMAFSDIATADLKNASKRQLIYIDGEVKCEAGRLIIKNNPLEEFPFRFFNLHAYDYGLFYGNIMENTLVKAKAFKR